MLSSLAAANIPARISLSAGAYLCNQVFYGMMHHIKQNNWPIRAGFIHLPSLDKSKSPSEDQCSPVNLATCITAARILIKTLIEENETLM
jgi:pyroglutamyl-peptidase